MRKWTKDELEFLAQWGPYVDLSDLARVLNRLVSSVATRLKRHSLKNFAPKKRKPPKPQPFMPIEMTDDQKSLERDFYAVLLAAWREGNKDVGRVMDYFHTERRIIHGWQDSTQRFGMG